MSFVLFDDHVRFRLFPFTLTRPVADIRCGILTMRERWEKLLEVSTGTLTEPYLQKAFPENLQPHTNTYINGAIFGTEELTGEIRDLGAKGKNWKLVKDDVLIAFNCEGNPSLGNIELLTENFIAHTYHGSINRLSNLWDIFSKNDAAIKQDFQLITRGRNSAPIPQGVMASGLENIFIEEGANIYQGCILNGHAGPIYIASHTEVLEGVMIRGPFALCEHGVLKMGAKVYGATTLGPGCKAGGELNNVVFFANSNKAHDGYLGNAVIGEWCNLGADTNCSNLKNNYDEVKIWDMHHGRMQSTGLIFCGLLMGDHSKCGINTMFNTGTVAGVSCNIFGGDFPEKYIPSFSWGGGSQMVTYQLDKAIETANRMMGRRGLQLSDAEKEVFHHIFHLSAIERVG